ncbi:CSC1-like protein [Actinidia chinensis var. chinensis]|uniref:CSC1-like protein n=1 Tax=Actinidia chinensis var. chinensis TaxID=1590841 RepID=A0A2R6QQW5_ACTCC|nr:CSC1-like protein [Actinidia chinensis var. chinensis]
MIVSSLLTSVGINFGLCVLFFTLYSVLRKQPSNYDVYIPRLVADGKSQKRSRFNLERLLPTPGWLRRAWQPSEEELLASSGLDAVVFMRIIIFSLKVFCFAGIIGIFILLPVNFTGSQLQNVDFANLTNDSLDVFSISNVDNGSKRLWIHFSAVYIVTIFVCYLLYCEYRYVSFKRLAYFYSSEPQPHQFTILVRSIPVSAGASISDSVYSFFTEYHPSTYISHMVIRRTNKLRNLISDMRRLSSRLIHLRGEPTRTKCERCGCCGMFRRKIKVDLANHYEKKLEDLEENLRLEQSEVSLAGQEVRAAFVSFKSRYGAACAFHMQQSINPTQWVTEQAPEPRDVYWPFFSSTFMGTWISKLLVIIASIALTTLFLLPVLFVQGLANLDQLEIWFPFLESILSITFISQVVTGYFPNLILQLFLKVVPPIMKFFSSIQGYISNSDIEKSACDKVVWFTIWNVFFGNVLSGSVLNQVSILLEPKKIPGKLAVTVPAQASFFIAYVVTSGWTSVSSELVRVIPLIFSLIRKPCISSEHEFEVPSLPYHRDIPKLLFFGLLGITYFFLAPLILPFLLIYFCVGYIIYRNQFINVYAPKYETAGKFWPIVHNSMIFSLLLMHAIALGIFTLKKLPLASTSIIPLPILTLLFNAYCRKRFLPIFIAYSAETLIKKDREDRDVAAMAEFFDKMETSYQDPALLPIQYSINSDSHTSPLLYPAIYS